VCESSHPTTKKWKGEFIFQQEIFQTINQKFCKKNSLNKQQKEVKELQQKLMLSESVWFLFCFRTELN